MKINFHDNEHLKTEKNRFNSLTELHEFCRSVKRSKTSVSIRMCLYIGECVCIWSMSIYEWETIIFEGKVVVLKINDRRRRSHNKTRGKKKEMFERNKRVIRVHSPSVCVYGA